MALRIVITGTSGVGKTYLESLLQNDFDFIQLPKYTNRPKRPGEIEGNGIYFLKKIELINNVKNYFFSLDYTGYTYSWKTEDLNKYNNNNVTMAITLESLSRFLKKDLNFIPIVLYVDKDNLELLRERIKLQLDYSNLNTEGKLKSDYIIKDRIELAKIESGNIEKYINLINKNGKGRAFKIIDDSTIPKEVIPYILEQLSAQLN